MQYYLDGEGRITSTNYLSGTNYSPAGQITGINYTSGDSDAYTYDPSGRMNKYQFNVGPQSMIGTPSWNANGTLASVSITDPFNSADSQTCNYSHDDLMRIAAGNCGSWSQTFSYDAFGNMNKAGNSSFNAAYTSNPQTNRMTQIGSSTPAYDGDGNVTNDFLNTYSWDAAGRPVTVDGVGITYDGLGRMVELNRSGSYSEIAYSTTGVKLRIMNGQSVLNTFVPTVGQQTMVLPNTGSAYYTHFDWLGSARLTSTVNQTFMGDLAYAPFGETYASSGTPYVSFTDIDPVVSPPNVYDFPAREYGIQGRWPSPDPAGMAAVNSSDPQSWDRYAYVLNRPDAMTDPDGRDGVVHHLPPAWLVNALAASANSCDFLCSLVNDVLNSATGGLFSVLFDTPQAGAWNEQLPAGVPPLSVLGRRSSVIANPCTYGSGSCGGGVYSLISGKAMQWSSYADYLDWLLSMLGPNAMLSPGLQILQNQVRARSMCEFSAADAYGQNQQSTFDATETVATGVDDPLGGPLGPDPGMSPEIPEPSKHAPENGFLILSAVNWLNYRGSMRACAAQNPITGLVP